MSIDWTAALIVLLAVTGWGLLLLAVIACRQVIAECAAAAPVANCPNSRFFQALHNRAAEGPGR